MGYAERNKLGERARNEREEFAARITANASAILENWTRPIHIETDIAHVVALIGTVQLALRHPHAQSSSSMISTKKLLLPS